MYIYTYSSCQDYRFMPEPNLPPLRLVDQADMDSGPVHTVNIAPLRRSLPELPTVTRQRLCAEHGLTPERACSLVNWPESLRIFLVSVSCGVVRLWSARKYAYIVDANFA